MRVLFAVHHPLDPRLGAPGASIAVAAELGELGHDVEFFGYDQAFPGRTSFTVRHQILFPWKLGAFLIRHAYRFDVLDITSGDAYVWAAVARALRRRRTTIVTRSNGLEHLAHAAVVAQARRGTLKLSRRYPIYHGGLRLWEVAQSIRCSDAVLVLTEDELRFVADLRDGLEVATRVVPHGVDETLLASPMSLSERPAGPIRLCFLGNWTDGKGTAALVAAANELGTAGVAFDLLIAGTGAPDREVIRGFANAIRSRIRVIDRFERSQLGELLADRDVLLFPSRSEGFGLAVVEAMACGVVPVTTPVGVVPSVVDDGANGILVGFDRPMELVAAVQALSENRDRLDRMRYAAAAAVQSLTWSHTARATLELYEVARAGSRRRDT